MSQGTTTRLGLVAATLTMTLTLLGRICFAWAPETAAGLTEAAAYASPLHVLLIEDWGRPLGLYEPLAMTVDADTKASLGRIGDAEGLAPAFFNLDEKKRPAAAHISGRHSALGWILLGAANAAIDARSADGGAALDSGKVGSQLMAQFTAAFAASATAATKTGRDAASVTTWLTLGALAHLLERNHMPATLTESVVQSVASTFGRYGIPNATMAESPPTGPIKALFSSRRRDGATPPNNRGDGPSQKIMIDLLGQIGGRVEGLLQRLFAARLDLKSDDDSVVVVYDGPAMEQAKLTLLIEDDAGDRQPAPAGLLTAPAEGTQAQAGRSGPLELGPVLPAAKLGRVASQRLSGAKLVALIEGKDAAGDTIVAVKETPVSTLRRGFEDASGQAGESQAPGSEGTEGNRAMPPVDPKTIPFGPEPPPATK